MRIEVTAEDIMLARKRAGESRSHLWHHPVAIALERACCAYAAITERRVHLCGTLRTAVYDLHDEARYFHAQWLRDRAQPETSLLVWEGPL